MAAKFLASDGVDGGYEFFIKGKAINGELWIEQTGWHRNPDYRTAQAGRELFACIGSIVVADLTTLEALVDAVANAPVVPLPERGSRYTFNIHHMVIESEATS